MTFNAEQCVITIFGPESLPDPLYNIPLPLIFLGCDYKIILHQSEYLGEILALSRCPSRLSSEKGNLSDEYINRDLCYKGS